MRNDNEADRQKNFTIYDSNACNEECEARQADQSSTYDYRRPNPSKIAVELQNDHLVERSVDASKGIGKAKSQHMISSHKFMAVQEPPALPQKSQLKFLMKEQKKSKKSMLGNKISHTEQKKEAPKAQRGY